MSIATRILSRLRAGALWLVLPALPLCAQQPEFTALEVHVTAASPASIYLDLGSDAGVEVGDRVRLYPESAPLLEAVIRSVSRQSARAESSSNSSGLGLGTRGEVLVPTERLQLLAAAQGAQAHPAWEQSVDGWDSQLPLLAVPDVSKSRARELVWSGRTYFQVDHTLDRVIDNSYAFARLGTVLRLENPFERAGALELRGEFEQRDASTDGSGDDLDRTSRLERLSYHWGDELDAPRRYEIGRFAQHEFPELGVIDGAEVLFRPSPLDRWGASFGYSPSYTAEMKSGEDAQVAAYYRHLFDPEESASVGLAYQKTFHRGAADRDLLLLDGRWFRPGALALTGTAWIDYYAASDDPKSAGFELTQLYASANLPIGQDSGLGANASYVRFPSLLNDELPTLPEQSLLDHHVQRVSLNGWHRLRPDLRLHARADAWEDQDDSGGSGEVGARWRRALFDSVDLNTALFASDGKSSSLTGMRVGASRSFSRGSFGCGWELAQNQASTAAGDEALLQQALRASLDLSLGRRWSLSAYFEDRFGDEQDSLAAGLYISRRY
jgi:hypothetical protein